MILVGNQRGGAKDLATHLMKAENESVRVHSLRGFASNDLHSAFQESYAMSRATKCKQHLFSLSLNPPKEASVSDKDFEAAIAKIETELGLERQPRAIVFHEKLGRDGEMRRHAHAVWSRIDPVELKAVQLSFTKNKLQEIARDLYIEHDWQMPRGFLDKAERDPLNFTLEEWQQAKRAGKDPKEVKGVFKNAWAISDSRASFGHALKEHGYILARGRRGHVAVDYQGEVYAISRSVGLRAKQVRARLGEHDDLPSVENAHEQAAGLITDRLRDIQVEQADEESLKQGRLAEQRERQREQHIAETQSIAKTQSERLQAETAQREARFNTGLHGLWDRITGKRRRTAELNAQEELQARERDRQEKQAVTLRQTQARTAEYQKADAVKSHYQEVKRELDADIQKLEPPREALSNEVDKDAERINALQERLANNRQQARQRSSTRQSSRGRSAPSFER